MQAVCLIATIWSNTARRAMFLALAVAMLLPAQETAGTRLDWRRFGNLSIAGAASAGVASGPVSRVWYPPSGEGLMIVTPAGQVWETKDFELWTAAAGEPPSRQSADASALPEASAQVQSAGGRLYAAGAYAWSSDDEGRTWRNLTQFAKFSILGGPLSDLAISPVNPDDIAVANSNGVWRSLDGGMTWDSLNALLPNLPAAKLLRAPQPRRGLILGLSTGEEAEWAPGERAGWRPVEPTYTLTERAFAEALAPSLGTTAARVTSGGRYLYAGSVDGRLFASSDEGRTWREFRFAELGRVEAIFVDPREPQIALVAVNPGAAAGARVLRTTNGGIFWDDLSANLPAGAAHGVTADLASGTVYLATEAGLFLTVTNLRNATPASRWERVDAGLPQAPVRDVMLDAEGNQLYAALSGHGVYRTLAPHRLLDPRVVNAADFSTRAAAPGSLLSVLGRRVSSARMGTTEVPVLAASESESQIQVPFEASGATLSLDLSDGTPEGRRVAMPLRPLSPAIFVDRDGSPMILDADRGLLLDSQTQAAGGGRIQILTTGLGRVTPEWPTGLAAPVEGMPKVAVPVRVYLDRVPLRVTRATLAPGYIGFYLVEAELPDVVNAGPAELYLEAGGSESNRVSLYLRP
ncbi:MAG: hypothetical protein ABI972_05920 [Acidobacteriota bacterium]